MVKITAKILMDKHTYEGMSVYDVEKFTREQNLEYPKTPKTPKLKSSHSSDDLIKYQGEFSEYQNVLKKHQEVLVEYELKLEKYRVKSREISDAMEEFIKLESGFYDNVPKDKQSKVWSKAWSKAWSDGHSNGYSEVSGHLSELIDLFV